MRGWLQGHQELCRAWARTFLLLLVAWDQLGQEHVLWVLFCLYSLYSWQGIEPDLFLCWDCFWDLTWPDSGSDPNLAPATCSSSKSGSENGVEPEEIPLQRLSGCLGAGEKLPPALSEALNLVLGAALGRASPTAWTQTMGLIPASPWSQGSWVNQGLA